MDWAWVELGPLDPRWVETTTQTQVFRAPSPSLSPWKRCLGWRDHSLRVGIHICMKNTMINIKISIIHIWNMHLLKIWHQEIQPVQLYQRPAYCFFVSKVRVFAWLKHVSKHGIAHIAPFDYNTHAFLSKFHVHWSLQMLDRERFEELEGKAVKQYQIAWHRGGWEREKLQGGQRAYEVGRRKRYLPGRTGYFPLFLFFLLIISWGPYQT